MNIFFHVTLAYVHVTYVWQVQRSETQWWPISIIRWPRGTLTFRFCHVELGVFHIEHAQYIAFLTCCFAHIAFIFFSNMHFSFRILHFAFCILNFAFLYFPFSIFVFPFSIVHFPFPFCISHFAFPHITMLFAFLISGYIHCCIFSGFFLDTDKRTFTKLECCLVKSRPGMQYERSL